MAPSAGFGENVYACSYHIFRWTNWETAISLYNHVIAYTVYLLQCNECHGRGQKPILCSFQILIVHESSISPEK